MPERLINIFSKIIEGGIILLAFLLPLIFLPITSEAFEFPKQIFLIFFISFLAIIWVIKMILAKSVKILHSPLTLPIIVFFSIFLVSAIFSVHRFSSIYGPYPRLHGGLVSLLMLILIFFLVATNIKEKRQIARILVSLSLSGFLLAVVGFMNFFDLPPLGDFLRGRFLTPAGSATGTSLFLALLLPAPLFTFFFEKRKILQLLSGIISIFFICYIFLINQLAAVLSVFLIFLLIIFFSRLKLSRGIATKIGALFLLSILLLTINDWGFVRSKIPLLEARPIQRDITLNQNTGWAIAIGGSQNLKLLFLGSGPGTYLFDFTSFKPSSFNQSSLWDIRLEKSSNEYFQIISVLGLLGLLAFIYLLITIGKFARAVWQKGDRFSQICFSSVIIFILISLFNASSTLPSFSFWLFLGLTLSSARLLNLTGVREIELSLATIQIPGKPKMRKEILPWLVALIAILVLTPLIWQVTKIFIAELSFTKAQLEQLKAQPNTDLILQSLRKARETVPANDNYRRALSNIYLNLAILGTQQNLLSEEAKQQLLTLAVQEGESAVFLAPHNIFNWENLQQIYLNVTPYQQDAALFSNILAQEILLDPFNPRHYNDKGWIYFNLRGDIEAAKDDFRASIRLKPDFPDAHYNLAIVYGAEGEKEKALQEYGQTLSLLNQQINSLEQIISARPDLQTLINQLKQLESQISSEREILLQEEQQLPEIIPPEETETP